jgi:hypothetical protein
MAAPEVAAVCDLSEPVASEQLGSLTARWKARVTRYPCGEVFTTS